MQCAVVDNVNRRAIRPLENPEATEFMITLATCLPLDPGDATQAPSEPTIEGLQLAPLAEAEVAAPSPQVWYQLADQPFQAEATVSRR